MDSYKLLAVDDDLVDLESIKRSLRNEKSIKNKVFDISTVTSGEACLDFLDSNSCDLVLLDCNMPKLSGYDTCRAVKKIKPDLPVIILTGMTDDKSIKQAFEAGADDYTTKPIRKIELVLRINNALRIKESDFELKSIYSGLMQDLSVASKVQSYVIPDWCRIEQNFLFTSFYRASNKVSGDLFDIIKISESKCCLYIGDISGHGVQAALLMVAIQTVIKMFINDDIQDLQLHLILNRLNRIMAEKFLHRNYLTILIGILDLENKTFQYQTAGHPPLITYNTCTGEVNSIMDSGNLPVGMLKETDYLKSDTNNLPLDNDTAFIMYTDGIFECKNNKDDFLGLEGLVDTIKSIGHERNIAIMHEKIVDRIKQNGFIFEDDITFLAFQCTDNKPSQTFFELIPQLDTIEHIVKKIITLVKTAVSDNDIESKVELICHEILNNIIIHGYTNQESSNFSKILINVTFSEEKTELIFWDYGAKWKLNEPQSENGSYFSKDDISDVSGRGLKIIKTLSSSFTVDRYGNINETKVSIQL